MSTMLLSIILLVNPQPAGFKFVVTAEPYTKFVILQKGRIAEPNTLYRTQPLQRNMKVEFEVRWLENDEIRHKFIMVEFCPGQIVIVSVKLPKVRPIIANC